MQILKEQKNYLSINLAYHLILFLKDFHFEFVYSVIVKVLFDFLAIFPVMYNILNI